MPRCGLYNVSQLKAVQTTVASIDQSAVKYETNADGTMNYNSVKQGGTNTNAPVTLHNVADGVAGNDAVNVNQLNAGLAAASLRRLRRPCSFRGSQPAADWPLPSRQPLRR